MQLFGERSGEAVQPADDPLRARVEVWALAPPLLLDAVYMVVHSLDITFRGRYSLFRGR